MEITQLFIVSVTVMGLCCLAMAVGVIIKNKTFTSCACASITYRGEKICCPSCPDKDEPAPAVSCCGGKEKAAEPSSV